MKVTLTNEQLAEILSQVILRDLDQDKHKDGEKVLKTFKNKEVFSVEEFWLRTIATVGFRHYHNVNVILQSLEKSEKVNRCRHKKESQMTGRSILAYQKK